jgi:hypothetical protein
MKKRGMHLLCISLCLAKLQTQARDPLTDEGMFKVLTAKDKLVTDMESAERQYLTPKEYGIKKLGHKKL